VSKILAAHPVRPHKIEYYLERRDPEFEAKMTEVLHVYREVAVWRKTGLPGEVVGVLSSLPSVADIVDGIMTEADAVLRGWCGASG